MENEFIHVEKYNFSLHNYEDYGEFKNDMVQHILIKKEIPNLDFSIYENVEILELKYNLKNDIDLSSLNKLKYLHISVDKYVNIILPRNIETLIIYSVNISQEIMLYNYESIKNLKLISIQKHNIDLTNMLKLERLYLENTMINIDNLNKLENLYYFSIVLDDDNIKNINFNDCKNLIYIFINMNELTKIILPKSGKLKYLYITNFLFYDEDEEEYHKENLIIDNLYINKNIEELRISYKTDIDYNNFDKLNSLSIELDPNNNIIYSLDIHKLFKLKKLQIQKAKLSFIDFPYNFKFQKYVDILDNTYQNKKILSRRRIYLLCESKVGVLEEVAESPPKGHVEDVCESKVGVLEDVCESKVGALNGLSELLSEDKCFRCKKNISLNNKINIRNYEDQKYRCNYLSCC